MLKVGNTDSTKQLTLIARSSYVHSYFFSSASRHNVVADL